MTTRIVLGKDGFGGGTVGLWVSKPGINAAVSGSADNFLVHPGKINFQPFISGAVQTLSLYASSGPTLFSDGRWRYSNQYRLAIAHGLTHVPMFFGSGPSNCSITADLANVIINATVASFASPNSSTGSNPAPSTTTLSFPFSYVAIRVFG